MKRTAKWQKPLTLKQLKHMKEMNVPTLAGFKRLRIKQRELAARFDDPLWRICPECHEIERRLKAAGHNFPESENSHGETS